MSLLKQIRISLKVLAVLLGSAVIFFFACVYYPYSYLAFPDPPGVPVLIRGVNVVDVEAETVLMNHDVLIRDGKIDSVSRTPIVLSEQAKVIDARGKYLISALWDMHVHISSRSPYVDYPEFIRHGITHVRDMRGAHDHRDPFASVKSEVKTWNELVKKRALAGPLVHGYTSFAVNGPGVMFNNSPDYFNCSTREQAVQLVKHFKAEGIDLIKVYDNIPPDAFFKLMEEAGRVGIAVAGHKPVRVSTIDAANAGMRSMEHARFLIWDSFQGADDLRKDPDPKSRDNTGLRERMLNEHDTVMLHQMFDALLENGVWYCPTHITRKSDAFASDNSFRERYRHINPVLKFLAEEDLDATVQEDPTPRGREIYKAFYERGLNISGKAYRHGIKILAGSDGPELPGSSLHEELAELKKAGLPPFEILRTATLYPASYYEMSDHYGSIKEQKTADLLILSESPIDDISNIRKIETIISNGALLDSAHLTSLQQDVAGRRSGIVMTCKLIWDVIVYMTL